MGLGLGVGVWVGVGVRVRGHLLEQSHQMGDGDDAAHGATSRLGQHGTAYLVRVRVGVGVGVGVGFSTVLRTLRASDGRWASSDARNPSSSADASMPG